MDQEYVNGQNPASTKSSAPTPSPDAEATTHRSTPDQPWPHRSLLWYWIGAGLVVLAGAWFLLNGIPGGDEAAHGGDGQAEAFDEDGFRALPFTTEDGSTATLALYDGEPLVVNFFAAWCPPCRAELPDFQAVYEQRADDVTFVGVSHDFNEDSWRALINESGVTFDTVFQPGQEIWTDVGGVGMPTTVFVNADGEVVDTHSGLLTAEQLNDLIDEHLA